MKENLQKNLQVVLLVFVVVVGLTVFSVGSRWLLDNAPQPTPALTEESCPIQTTPTATPTPTTTPTPTVIDQSAIAVEQGVETLFTMDHESGVTGWLERICAIGPEACETGYWQKPRMEALLEQNQPADQTATATAILLVQTVKRTKISHTECWVVEYTLSGWGETETQLIWACVEVWPETGHYAFIYAEPDYPQSILQDILEENGIETPVP